MMKRSIYILIVCTLCLVSSCQKTQTLSHPIVDAHVHVRVFSDEGWIMTMEDYFAENESLNIQYIFGITMARKGNIEETTTRNDSLFAISQRESRIIPVYSVHPEDGEDAIKELHRIKEMGGKIIKLHPQNQNFTILSDGTINVAKAAGKLELIILIDGYGSVLHADYVEQLLQLAGACYETKFIIAHMGGTDFYKLGIFNLAKSTNLKIFENVWFDLSATVKMYAGSPYQSQLEWIIRGVGVDRVLFGSDCPAVSLSAALEAFCKFDFDDTERERILYKNAIELLGL